MYKELLRSIENIATFPIISLILFVLIFAIMLWWTFAHDNSFLKQMSLIPLDTEESEFNNLENDDYEVKS